MAFKHRLTRPASVGVTIRIFNDFLQQHHLMRRNDALHGPSFGSKHGNSRLSSPRLQRFKAWSGRSVRGAATVWPSRASFGYPSPCACSKALRPGTRRRTITRPPREFRRTPNGPPRPGRSHAIEN